MNALPLIEFSVELWLLDILVFSDGMVPQAEIAWNGNNALEMLRQFLDRMGQPHPPLIITHIGLIFDLSLQKKKRSMIDQVKPPIDINLTKF